MNKNSLNNNDYQKNIVKYLLFGLIVGVSVRYIPTQVINQKEIIMIAAIASITFAILDMVSPSIKVK
jgi:hypothetical protein